MTKSMTEYALVRIELLLLCRQEVVTVEMP